MSEYCTIIFLVPYLWSNGLLVSQIHAIETEDGRPLQLAVHPSGDGVLCAFANSCRYLSAHEI